MRKKKSVNVPKRYAIISKVYNYESGGWKVVKYHVNDLLKFEAFIIAKFGKYAWMNVYDHKYKVGQYLCSYTVNHRPTSSHV